MTEEEMKKTWCPDARCAPGGYNRDADGGRATGHCLGSQCSAWRWTTSEPCVEVHAGDPKHTFIVDTLQVARSRNYAVVRILPRHGYCGRAGRPE